MDSIKDFIKGNTVVTPYTPTIDLPENKKFVAAFRAKFNIDPSLPSVNAYDAAKVILAAASAVKGNLSDKDKFLAAISKVSRTITSNLYLEDILKLIVTVAAEVTNSKICSLMLIDEKTNELVLKATQSMSEAYNKKPPLKLGEGIAGRPGKENRQDEGKDDQKCGLCALARLGSPHGRAGQGIREDRGRREDSGEIEAAQARTLPKLVQLSDVQGDFHMHTNRSDGSDTLETMIEAAKVYEQSPEGMALRWMNISYEMGQQSGANTIMLIPANMPTAGVASTGISGMGYFGFQPLAKGGARDEKPSK
jgi:hypothetical protein